MGLFIALFGSIYYLLKYFGYKQDRANGEARYQKARREDEAARRRWESRVLNPALEEELRSRLRRPDRELLDELAASGLWFEGVRVFLFERDIPDALRILMANRGFLPESDAKDGIRVYFGGKTREAVADQCRRQTDFILYMNRKLREHGTCQDMFLDAPGGYYCFPLARTPIPGGATVVGRVVWRPMVHAAYLLPGSGKLIDL